MRRGLILLGSCAALALPAMVMAQTPPATVPPPVASKVMAPAGWAEFRQGQADAARGDSAGALQLYKLAASKGSSDAENAIAGLYAGGEAGLPQDYAQAMRWYRISADHGNQWAQLNIGYSYYLAMGVPHDDVEAMRWYRLSAAQGNAFAEQNIGAYYANGQGGVAQDYGQALHWFGLAAAQGNPSAQFNLGNLYYAGRGVPQDYTAAMHWYRLVTDQADRWINYPVPAVRKMVAAAQYRVGSLYANGQGVAPDAAQARVWMTKAAQNDDPSAKTWLAANPG